METRMKLPKSRGHYGEGTIYKDLRNGKTRYRWQLVAPLDPSDPSGESRRVSRSGFKTKKEALEDLRKTQAHVKNLRAAVPSPMQFEVFANDWLEAQGSLAASTAYGYRKILRTHLLPKFKGLLLTEITPPLIEKFYTTLKKSGRKDTKDTGGPLSTKTITKIHMVLRSILEQAVEDGKLQANPCRSGRVQKQIESRRTSQAKLEVPVFTAEEMSLAFELVSNEYGDYLYPLWHLIGFSGMRRGEALALRWSDIDWKNNSVSIVRAADSVISKATKPTKTYKNRLVVLDSNTMRILKKYKADRAKLGLTFVQTDSFVFGTVNNELRGPNDATAHWSRLLEKLSVDSPSLPRVTLKGLRHSHATQLLAAGVNPKIVQERLGHSNISTTLDIYSHVTPTIQQNAIEQLMNSFPTGTFASA
jgi:integrase